MASLDKAFTGVLDDLQRHLRAKPEFAELINLGLGNPGTAVDKQLLHSLTDEIRQDSGQAKYRSTIGDLETRKAIATFLREVRKSDYDFDSDPQYNKIAVTAGVTASIKEYLGAINRKKNDSGGKYNPLRVLIPTPAYAWHFESVKTIPRAETIKLDTSRHNWKLDAQTLREALRHAPDADALLLNYPSNPTGQNLTKDEWTALAQVLEAHVKQHPDFRIILDNAYTDLQFGTPTNLFEVASPKLRQHIIEFNSVAKFHGFAGRQGPGFAASENTGDIAMLRKQIQPNQSIGYEAILRKAFSPEFVTPKRVEETLGRFRRRCRFVARYINEQLAAAGQNHLIALPPEGGMFVLADFSRWLGKKIAPRDANEMRHFLAETLPGQADYFKEELFKNNRINDDKDLSFYLTLKAKVVTIPGQDFGLSPQQGMLRLALGDIGDLTTYKHQSGEELFTRLLPEENRFEKKPLDDLRKLKTAVDRSIGVLKELDRSAAR